MQTSQLTDLTKKVNDHITNLEDVDKQITQLIQADEKITKDVADLSRKLEVVATTPSKDPNGD